MTCNSRSDSLSRFFTFVRLEIDQTIAIVNRKFHLDQRPDSNESGDFCLYMAADTGIEDWNVVAPNAHLGKLQDGLIATQDFRYLAAHPFHEVFTTTEFGDLTGQSGR